MLYLLYCDRSSLPSSYQQYKLAEDGHGLQFNYNRMQLQAANKRKVPRKTFP